ncbi:MAG: hypothetical protein ACTSQU_02030 [Promethearchaeota archaeon]
MVKHRKSFFGTNTGMIFDSGPSSSPTIFLTFIKKKEDGLWEKPSKKEGRTIKFSLVDIAFILQVLRREKNAWKTVHSFEEREISISFEWDSENKENLKVKAGNYLKLLNYGEKEIYKALLEHTFLEKVITSTEVKKREDFSEVKKETSQIIAKETSENKMGATLMETADLAGVCNGETEKALLIAFGGKKEIWVPKSTIHSSFDSKITSSQNFKIDTWILKKNNIM